MKNKRSLNRFAYFLIAVAFTVLANCSVFAQEFGVSVSPYTADNNAALYSFSEDAYVPCDCQTADIDFDEVYYGTPDNQKGEISTISFASGKHSFQAGLYVPYNYNEETTYNVVIFLQGYETNGASSPLKFLKELRLSKACDYLVSHELTEPFLFFSLPERTSRDVANLAALIAFIENNYNVYSESDHWAIIGFSSGAEHVKNNAMRDLHERFSYYAMCSDDEGGGDPTYLAENQVSMKLFLTASGNIIDESGVNEIASFRHAGEYQLLFGPYAERTEQWVFNGLGHGSWKTVAGGVIKFIPQCFKDPCVVEEQPEEIMFVKALPIRNEHISRVWEMARFLNIDKYER